MRVAVVTGGASGMGQAICARLAARGDAVGVLDIEVEGAERVAKEIRDAGGRAVACPVDVRERASVERAVGKVREEYGAVGILVTSAGVAAFQRFEEISVEAWERIIAVNLTGTFHCVQSVIGDMVEARWGRIVTISSSSGQRGAPRMAHYAASKGGVIAFMKALAREYGPYGITVNDVPPSSVATPMSRQAQERGDLPADEALVKAIPVGRLGTPEDVAVACAFLTSEEAGYISGQVLGVNGASVVV